MICYTRHKTQDTRHKPNGFTLIEISIVLVIIGLLIGGVLVGQDLYNAAKLRSTLSDMQEYQIAATTFRVTYQGVPGDARNYQNFGGTTRTHADRNGDGDGMIENLNGAFGALNGQLQNGETLVFWADMFDAGLIKKTSSIAEMAFLASTVTPETGLASYLPSTLWGNDIFLSIVRNSADPRQHHFMLSQISELKTSGSPTVTNNLPIPTLMAKRMDEKVDDGKPDTGRVIGGSLYGASYSNWTGANTGCQTGSPAEYKVTNGIGCTMMFEVKF